MARSALTTTAAAFTATATLLLTACGGGGDDSSPDDIKGADKGANSSTPSASAAGASDVQRPEITIPNSFQLTFESWTSGDPDEQAVLTDGKEQLRAGYAAIIANDPDSEALAFYDTESGLSQDRKWVQSYTDKNLTVIGKLPVSDPEATLFAKKTKAQLRYCTDESEARTKNRKTGKVEANPPGTDPKVAYTVTMQKNAQGVWQAVSTSSKRGGCS
ncbi:lipoprotein [Streptomyces viridiviolaceus]|uniref:Lipoprotein n=1 Tax=Streptomyces viridiviolaceus TaxID=68282 RepID=A0ABW2E2T7_9ACTN|nr:hypothetical protein [Streptomyces viridiviolaceus]GHB55908.1 lipoprotein [Streptomyces viridiviolaceus]